MAAITAGRLAGSSTKAGSTASAPEQFGRQVDAADPRIVHHVAGDVGELEREPEVAGPVERVALVRPHAHDDRHGDADRTGHAVAIAEQVLDACRRCALRRPCGTPAGWRTAGRAER